MNIKSKDFVLMPRHLRKFNGSTVEMFGDEKGQLYILMYWFLETEKNIQCLLRTEKILNSFIKSTKIGK